MSEHDEQKALFDWAESMIAQGMIPELKNMFAIPNGGMRNKAVAVKLKQEGVKRGVPDIFLAHRSELFNKFGLFIEMKFGKNHLEKEQVDWGARLLEANYSRLVCYSWVEAAAGIIIYLGKSTKDFPEFTK
jgi:hypothetical protein